MKEQFQLYKVWKELSQLLYKQIKSLEIQDLVSKVPEKAKAYKKLNTDYERVDDELNLPSKKINKNK